MAHNDWLIGSMDHNDYDSQEGLYGSPTGELLISGYQCNCLVQRSTCLISAGDQRPEVVLWVPHSPVIPLQPQDRFFKKKYANGIAFYGVEYLR